MSRSARALAVGTVATAVVALVLVAGALRIGSQSISYLRDVNRSFAEQVAVLAARSNATGRQLGSIVPSMAASSRGTLEATLDTLVQQATTEASQAAQVESPAPTGGAGTDVARSFAQRAMAISDLRRTVDRLLVLSPLPTVTATDPPETVAPTPPALSSAAAVAALQRVGATIAASNRSYAAGRRALRSGPGKVVLPASAWKKGASSWSPTGAASLVAALGSSPTLAALHDVVLVTNALVLTPAPVPPETGTPAAGNSVEIPPTTKLSVSAVVADHGNVPARGVTVQVEVAPQTGKPPTRRSRTISLSPGGSASVALPAAPVVPTGHYTVTVTVSPPVPDATSAAVTSESLSVTVAPPTPPTVAQVSPDKGPARGGTRVVILGTGFRQATAVKFGTTDVPYTVVSGTEIKAVSPPETGNTAKVTVTVENPGGPSGFSAGNLFTYRGPHPAGGATTTTTTGPSTTTTG
jgi:hypothetical protein